MSSIAALAKQITQDFPAYTFCQAETFYWSPTSHTVFFKQLAQPQDLWSLLHEIAHGELVHQQYNLDIELLTLEAAAWAYAAGTLAPKYHVIVDENYMQDHLDTYRLWLHERSTCPDCQQTGLQTKNTYSCINCGCFWRANEARLCALRRIKLQG